MTTICTTTISLHMYLILNQDKGLLQAGQM